MNETANVNSIIEATMSKLKTLCDSDTVVGKPITVGEITIIPVSRITFGIASGGSDFGKAENKTNFGGGSGVGASVNPIAFLIVKGGDVTIMNINSELNSVERLITTVPETVDKIAEIFKK